MLGWFRQHATILMVVLGSAAMVIFGLGPAFDRWASGGSSGRNYENPTIATWKDGTIDKLELDRLQVQHYSAQRFIQAIKKEASERSDNYRPLAADLPAIPDYGEKYVQGELMYRMLFAAKAKEEGFVASDTLVDSYVQLLGGDSSFTPEDLKAINRSVNPRMPFAMVKEQMKTELLYTQMRDYLFESDLPIPPNPTEAMELFHQTSDQISCQVFPIDVESKLPQVTEKPSAADIKKLFEEGKMENPDPTGEKPGFKIGRKARLQYFTADYQRFLEVAMAEISEEELKAEYDRLVAEKNFLVMESIAEDNSFKIDTPPPGTDTPETETPDSGTKTPDDVDAPDDVAAPDDVEAPEGVDEPDMPAKEDKNQGDSASSQGSDGEASKKETPKKEAEEGKTSPDEPAGESDPLEKPVESAPESKGSEEPAKKKGDEQSFKVNQLKRQPVSVSFQDAEPDSNSEKSKQETPKEAETPKETKSPQEAETETPKETEAPAETETPDNSAEQGSDVAPPPGQTADATNEQTEPAAQPSTVPGMLPGEVGGNSLQEEKPEQKVKPLEDVRLSILRQMCREPATQAMTDAMIEVRVEVQAYSAMLQEKEDNPSSTLEIPEFDPKKIAAEFDGIEFKETELMDRSELVKTDFGRLTSMQSRATAADIVFASFDRKQLFDTEVFGGEVFVPNLYLFWFIEKQDSRVPELSECEDQIVDFWKNQKALELATAEANQIRDKINADRSKKMTEVYPENAKETGAFTWFNSQRQGISQVVNAPGAGMEFMSTAFSLGEMEAGVSASANRKSVYVIQSLSGARPVEEFGNDYLDNQFMRFQQIPNTLGAAVYHYQSDFRRKMEEVLIDEMEFRRVD